MSKRAERLYRKLVAAVESEDCMVTDDTKTTLSNLADAIDELETDQNGRACGHKSHEDCMICVDCGECSESLDEEDRCADCGGDTDDPEAAFDPACPDRNGNENCLCGFECPQCGNHDKLLLVGEAQFEVTDDGTSGPIEGVEWSDTAVTVCPKCNKQGVLDDFRIKLKPEESSG